MHLVDNPPPNLIEQQFIPEGTIVGKVGKTDATSPHLHFDVNRYRFESTSNYNIGDFVDPKLFFPLVQFVNQ